MKVKDAKDVLKVGDWVRVKDIECDGRIVEGEVGEIGDNGFYIWQNKWKGTSGNLLPETKKYQYSWFIDFSSGADSDIEIIIINKQRSLFKVILKRDNVNIFTFYSIVEQEDCYKILEENIKSLPVVGWDTIVIEKVKDQFIEIKEEKL